MFKNIRENDLERLKYLSLVGLVTFLLSIAEHTWSSKYFIKFLFIILYFIAGKNVITLAFFGLKNKKPLDENFLMTLATFAAIAIGKYHEAVFVMVFYNIGEIFEQIATNSSKESIKSLMNIVPKTSIRIVDGKRDIVDIEDIEVSDILEIRDGDKIPVDGIVISGSGSVDTSSLTGESIPIEINENDKVISSSILTYGIIKMKATKVFDDSIASKIIDLIEEGVENKSSSEKFITRFARIYTPIVVTFAVFLALIPPLFGGDWRDFLLRSATFLVLSCPCALVLSVPLSFISGLGLSSKNGILIKGSEFLETISKADVILTDKTGTLTTGDFKIKNIEYFGDDKEKYLNYIYNLEKISSHPIAKSIVKNLNLKEDYSLFKKIETIKGLGVSAISKNNEKILLGSNKFVGYKENDKKAIYLSIDDKIVTKISIEDEIKSKSFETVSYIKSNFSNFAIVSGDNKKSVEEIANKLDIKEYYAELMPEDKLNILKSFSKNGKITIFVGDGINDAPVLKASDVGISMGETSSDIAIESSDILITNGEFSQIEKLIKIANLSVKTVMQNVTFIMFIKILILFLGLLGKATMWMAIFGDVGVSIITILWAMRILNKKV